LVLKALGAQFVSDLICRINCWAVGRYRLEPMTRQSHSTCRKAEAVV
jgi:hypothetical protein